jgi:predicted DNA-binding ribbon-helix-helix protein
MVEEGKGRRNLSLTDQEWEALSHMAERMNMSRSALVGKFALGQLSADPEVRLMGEPCAFS